MNNRIALCLIIKGDKEEPERLQRCLNSIAKNVDSIYITITGDNPKEIVKICKEYKANISYIKPFLTVTSEMFQWLKDRFKYEPHIQVGDKIFEFDKARNFNFSQVPEEYDWILWLDTDDIFRGGEKLRDLIEQAEKQKVEAIYLNYLYHVELDDSGNIKTVVTQNPRERIIRNNCGFQWKGIIHEILTKDIILNPLGSNECDVVHLVNHDDRIASLYRNIKAVEATLATTNASDPRMIYYLAKLFSDIRTLEYDKRAQELMFEFLLGSSQSEWPEERTQAWGYIADIYNRNNEHSNAVKALMNGLMDDPENRMTFISLASSYTMMGEYGKALFWLKVSEQVPEKLTILATSPREERLRTLEIQFNCFYHLKEHEKARKVAEQIREFLPQNSLLAYSFQKTEELLSTISSP